MNTHIKAGKKCVFCGNLPDQKNLEHVIPKWLMRDTGEKENRPWSMGIDYGDENFRDKELSSTSFQFPACKRCNSKFANLEHQVSNIFKHQAIKNNWNLNREQWECVLDWFDKIRVGLFLGLKTLNKFPLTVDPTFYINNRVAYADRLLYIFRTKYKNDKSIIFYNSRNISFMTNPVILFVKINDLVFLNVSANYIISKYFNCRIPREVIYLPSGHTIIDGGKWAEEGSSLDCLMDKALIPPHIRVYQPMGLSDALPPPLKDERELIVKRNDSVPQFSNIKEIFPHYIRWSQQAILDVIKAEGREPNDEVLQAEKMFIDPRNWEFDLSTTP